MRVGIGDDTPLLFMGAMRYVTHPAEGLSAPLSKAGAEALPKFCSEFCVAILAACAWF